MSKKNLPSVEMAARAHTELSRFAAVTVVLEGGDIVSRTGQKTAEKIIALCEAEQQTQLRIYDAACEAINAAMGKEALKGERCYLQGSYAVR